MTDTATDVRVAERLVWTIGDMRQMLGGLSERAIEQMVARGELPRPRRTGKHRLWNAAAVRRAVDALTGGSNGQG